MKIKIGTRNSKLALAQTELVKNTLLSKNRDLNIEIVPIVTKGDKILDRPLSKIGGKGIFISEIERALLNGEIHMAVHSAKDLPTKLEENLEISAVLSRENSKGDPADVLVTPKSIKYKKTDSFTVGTGSERRALNIARFYPNAVVKGIRGNVVTRLNKMLNGEYDAVILAAAGLKRLGIDEKIFSFERFEPSEFLPAPCQGIIAIECVKGTAAANTAKTINDVNTFIEFQTMWRLTEALGADCTTPLGTYISIKDNKISLSASVNNSTKFFSVSDIKDYLALAGKAADFLGSD